jgi:hypothetical protein
VQVDIGIKELCKRRVKDSQQIDMIQFDLKAEQLKQELNL